MAWDRKVRWYARGVTAFDYTWHWFELMRAFFRRTADEGRQMVSPPTNDSAAGSVISRRGRGGSP